MWLFSLITTIYAAEKWMNSGRPDGGWFVNNASLDAMIGYSIPVFFTLILASFIQKSIASKMESIFHTFSLYPSILQCSGGHLE